MNSIFDIITKHGDKLEVFVSPKGRQVVKIIKDGVKGSVVKYPNGRIVKTISYIADAKAGTKLLDLLS